MSLQKNDITADRRETPVLTLSQAKALARLMRAQEGENKDIIEFVGKTSPTFQKEIHEGWLSVPSSFRDLLAHSGFNIYAASTGSALAQHLSRDLNSVRDAQANDLRS